MKTRSYRLCTSAVGIRVGTNRFLRHDAPGGDPGERAVAVVVVKLAALARQQQVQESVVVVISPGTDDGGRGRYEVLNGSEPTRPVVMKNAVLARPVWTK